VVVGGGISGIACARELAAAGVPVRVLDRGRRVGGRMAVRTVDGHAVDTGASYFTVSDPAFAAVADDWRQRGLARPWTDTFAVAGSEGIGESKSGPMRWAGTHGLRSLVEDLATGLDVVTDRTVASVAPGSVDGEPAAAVVLAMPDPQARRLGAPLAPDAVEYTPALVLAAGFAARTWVALDAAFVNDDVTVRRTPKEEPFPITFLADDGRRRGDDAPVLVAHSNAALAREHLADPSAAAAVMLDSVRRLTGVREEPLWSFVHRWTYAQPASTRDEPWHLSDDSVGLCGDGWSDRPRVEAAYLSGRGLGLELASRLAGSAGR
jgi:predicted NAD/FAD-dependent oxidoreductase